MIPVPGLGSVRCSWVYIKAQGFDLHGFLLYVSSDHFFPEYISGDGLGDLDMWTGNRCAVFIIHSPSQEWIDYTRSANHTWWQLFGYRTEAVPEIADVFRNVGREPILHIDDERKTIEEVFAPCLNQFQHRAEIANILRRFNLTATEHPCLILFKDLKDQSIWFVDLREMVGMPQSRLRKSLQKWFGGREFNRLLEEARNA